MQQQRCYQEENGSLPVCRKKVDTGVCLVLLFLWAAACPAQPSQAQLQSCSCELRDSLLHSLEHRFSLCLPPGGGRCHTSLLVRGPAGCNSLNKSSVPPCGSEAVGDVGDVPAVAMLSPPATKCFLENALLALSSVAKIDFKSCCFIP